MFGFLKRRAGPTIAISAAAYDEIAEKLGAALGEPMNDGGAVNMGDVIIVRGPESTPEPLAGHKPLSTVSQKIKRKNRG